MWVGVAGSPICLWTSFIVIFIFVSYCFATLSSNCQDINLLGACLVKTSFSRCNLRDAELSFSDATSATFRDANLDGCLMYRAETTCAHFDGAAITEASDIPAIRVVAA
jgi:uncharacterized protein YjbI with pentapeptide repeats